MVTVYYNSGVDEEQYSQFLEGFKKSLKNIRDARLKRKQTRADVKMEKAKADTIQANAQVEAAKALGKTQPPVTLAPVASAKTSKSTGGLSTGAIVGIGVGAVVVVGTIIYFVKRKK